MRIRSDKMVKQADGARCWYALWMGGPTLAKVEHCRLVTLAGDMRRTVVITGEADTFFSIPAKAKIMGLSVKGYVTTDDDGNIVFRHGYYS